jgi:uncharacterized protein (DUF885 family)
MKIKHLGLVVSALALAAGLGGCKKSNNAPPAATDSAAWAKFSDQFVEGYFKLNPGTAIYVGRHEFDGQLPDWSKEGLQKQAEFLKNSIDDAEEFDAGTLSKDQQFERAYLIRVAEGQLFTLEDADEPHKNLTYYIDGGLDPNVYIARPYADATTRMKAFIKYANAVPTAIAQIRANLTTPMPLSFIDYGIPGYQGFADYYKGDAKAAFASVKDPALQAEFDKAAAAASKAMGDMAAWLETQKPTATQDFALGEAKFKRMILNTEGVDTPLDELEAAGKADLKRNQDALTAACGTYLPGGTIQACMAKMNAAKPVGGPVAEARRQLPLLRNYLIANNIVSIPSEDPAQVEESPPYNRQNAAYIDPPQPFDQGLPAVYYIAPPDPKWTPEERSNYIPGKNDLLFTSVHEVWPGHFLQFLHSNKAKTNLEKVFVGYAFAEGWAHYSEEMMWDAGLGNGDVETHIGQISNALLRNCRFLSAIGLHARAMTQEESKKMFMTECFQDEGTAKQQSARGTYDPAYLNYTMGKLMIRKLREDWTTKQGAGGDKTKWKAFHDQFLSYGGPPIPLVRAQMMGGEAKAVF